MATSQNPGDATSTNTSGSSRGAILLADDEDALRDLIVRMIEHFGYPVFAACNGKEAIELYQQHSDDISLAIIDYKMPDFNGLELVSRLASLDPHCAFVIATGFSEDIITTDSEHLPIASTLQKPYRMAELKELIELYSPVCEA